MFKYWQEFPFSISLMVLQMQSAASHPASCTLVSAALGSNTAPDKKDIPVSKSMCETARIPHPEWNQTTKLVLFENTGGKIMTITCYRPVPTKLCCQKKITRSVWGEALFPSPFQETPLINKGLLHVHLNITQFQRLSLIISCCVFS